MQPQTTPASPPLVPPTMIGGEIPLIDVSGFLAGEAGAAERAAANCASPSRMSASTISPAMACRRR